SRGLERAARAPAARAPALQRVQPHRADRAGRGEALPPRRRPGRVPESRTVVHRVRHGTLAGGAPVPGGRGDAHGVHPDDAQSHDGLSRHGRAARDRPHAHDHGGGVHLHPLRRRREAGGGGARAGTGAGGEARVSSPEPRIAEEARERLDRIRALIEEGREDNLADLLSEFHPSDLADLVEELDEADRVRLLDMLPAEIASETLAEMEREERPEEILAALTPTRIGELIAALSDDDAVDLIRDVAPEDQARVLAALPRLEASELRRLLRYDEESAGGIMTTELVAISVHLTAAEAIQEVRRQARELGSDFYAVFVVDLLRRLLGTVTLQDLVLADPETPLAELVQPPVATVSPDTDQEEVGRIIARYNMPSVAVVGPENVLLGRITWDDVVDVLEAEQTEDILRLGGIVSEEQIRGRAVDAVRSRLPWLFVNLFTAAAAASVVYVFQETIARAVILAAIMPVIAGMG